MALSRGTSAHFARLRPCSWGASLYPADTGRVLPRLGKQMRLEEDPSTERKLRLALRRDKFLALAGLGFDRISHAGLTRWGVLRLGIAAMLRPGEVGATSANAFVSKRGLHWGRKCITWHSAVEGVWRHPFLYLHVLPIKAGTMKAASRKRVPIPVGALLPEGVTDDPRCPYSVIAKLWQRDARSPCGRATRGDGHLPAP